VHGKQEIADEANGRGELSRTDRGGLSKRETAMGDRPCDVEVDVIENRDV
jgi:hypothetical protein